MEAQSAAETRRVFDRHRSRLGRLAAGLDILVADVARTIALASTLQHLIVLGLLVVIRTFLSWSLVVELDGHRPWRESRQRGAEGEADGAAV